MQKYFAPKDDITAFELANVYANVSLGVLSGPLTKRPVEFTDQDWADLPDAIKRHWADSPHG